MNNYMEKFNSLIRYDGTDDIDNYSQIEFNVNSNHIGFKDNVSSIYLDKNFEVHFRLVENSEMYKRHGGNLKINSDCVNIYLFLYGNGGFYDLLMLKKDGTVDRLKRTDIYNGNIDIKKIENVKNVINILPINLGGASSYSFVTITEK